MFKTGLKNNDHCNLFLLSDTTVLWGRYAVTYEALDKNGNAALCNFMVYAKGEGIFI